MVKPLGKVESMRVAPVVNISSSMCQYMKNQEEKKKKKKKEKPCENFAAVYKKTIDK